MSEFYKILKKKEATLTEDVFVQPLNSYETIIAAVYYALNKNEGVEALVEEILKSMNECESESMPVPMIYPTLIATYPDMCLFDLGPKTFKASYTYDNSSRKATIGAITEVILDLTVKTKPKETEDEE